MRDIDELRPLTAGQLLELWRSCREIEDPLERTLRCNARIVSRCCFYRGGQVYRSGTEALADLTGRQLERLLLRLAEGGGGEGPRPGGGTAEENPGFDAARFQELRGE